MTKIRFAIVGCGSACGMHLAAFAKLTDCAAITAVCDEVLHRAERTAARAEAMNDDGKPVPVFTDLDTMLREADFDVLDVCTPSGLHAACGIAGAKAGKHVVVEKPIDISLRAADALIAACHENGVTLMVISQNRWAKGIVQLKEWLHEGRLGRLCYAEAMVKWYRTQEYYDSGGWRGTWGMDGGGALMNQGVHYADQLRWTMGPVTSVSAVMNTLAHERVEVEDVVTASIQFANGAVGTLMASTDCWPGHGSTLELYGTEGAVKIAQSQVAYARFVGDEEAISEASAPAGAAEDSDPKAVAPGGHTAQLLDLISALREGRPPLVTGEEGRNALELVLAVYQAARTGERVLLPLSTS